MAVVVVVVVTFSRYLCSITIIFYKLSSVGVHRFCFAIMSHTGPTLCQHNSFAYENKFNFEAAYGNVYARCERKSRGVGGKLMSHERASRKNRVEIAKGDEGVACGAFGLGVALCACCTING